MESFLASITICGFNFAPRGYAFCDGQILPLRQNTALFSLLGTSYGGDGKSTFGLPDLRGLAPIHQDGQNLYLGERNGAETQTLLTANLPTHTHTMAASSGTGGNGAANSYPGGSGQYDSSAANVVMSPAILGATGGTAPVNLMKPYTAMNFVIAMYGVFPPRG